MSDTGVAPSFRLGLVGLNPMGLPIAKRLLSRNWRVTAWDRDPAAFEPLRDTAAKWVLTPGAVRAASDLVLIHIGSDAMMERVCFSADGLISTKGAHIVIDLSTTGAEVTQRAAETLDVAWVDSPLMGNALQAGAGELSLMVGATQELFDWVKPVLDDIATNVTLMGPLGAGQTAMMISRALVGTSYVMLAEVLAQVKAAGIDGAKLVQSLKGGLGDSTMLQQVLPQMIEGTFDPPRVKASKTMEELMAVRAFNEANGLGLAMQEIAIDQFRHFADNSEPETDSAAIAMLYETGDATD